MSPRLTPKEVKLLDMFHSLIKKIFPSLKWILIFSVSIIIGSLISLYSVHLYFSNSIQESALSDSTEQIEEDDNCNIIGVNLHGYLVTYNSPDSFNDQSNLIEDQTASEEVTWYIKQAQKDDKIKAIVVEVDSGGGASLAGEEISNAIKNSEKPVVAFIRSIGASAAYFSISSADIIFASRFSDVGSIGVTMSYLNNVESNKKEGYTYEQLTAGKYKDTGNPDRALTNDEKALLMRDVNITYDNFVKAVAKNRKLDIAKVKSFADGSTVMGEKAVELGLVDKIGGIKEVETYLESIGVDKPEVCWK